MSFFEYNLMKSALRLLSALLFGFAGTVLAAEPGEQSPACTMSSFIARQNIDIQQFAGQVVYLDFWASWCPPCAKSFPFLNALHHDFQLQGLAVIGVNMDEELADAQAFLQRHPAHFALVTDEDKQCAKGFDVRAMPSSYLIDRNGVIRHVHLGFRSGDRQALREQLKALLAESVRLD